MDHVLLLLMDALDKITSSWATECIKQWISLIEQKRSVGSFLPTDPGEVEEFLKAVVFASQSHENEILERVFSTRCFRDSKKFERLYRGRLIRVLKRYSPNQIDSEELSDEEILNQIGIVKYPEQIAFCGRMKMELPNGTVDFSPLQSGTYINAADISESELNIDDDVKKVLLIENKANYVDYILNHKNSDEFIVYHGGCYSPAKGQFFQKLKQELPLGTQ